MDPLMATAATTLAAWTTTELAQGGRLAVSALIDFLRDRFRREPEAREAIEGVLQQPSPDAARRLTEVLDREALRDPAFRTEFQARWERADAAVAAGPGSVANSVSGDVSGPVVQARDVHGGISFGGGGPRH
ncbi:hypothetical protein [Micromonospora sagamiensis]|uniref:Uncharacterized protein n=1 Tax=Micromonospora sagamiensis TaxID=47875 RepID=A0A562WL42_9ACTN|nr:hypothetical protein [Micromonospora sagamiensis]TWJ30908.1 hypothetical protein JD81_04457 [Micromonospora sagamiensis]BCL16053.1 hypothetical protein GCM10017556_37920 [Micromonospora sagamiensis]